MATQYDLDDIADRLILEMSPDCAPNCHATAEQTERLRAGIAKMVDAGVEFTDDDIELIAVGEHGEAEERFGPVPGWAEVNEALSDIFENEEEWS